MRGLIMIIKFTPAGVALCLLFALACCIQNASAVEVPSSADSSRISIPTKPPSLDRRAPSSAANATVFIAKPLKVTKFTHLTLKEVHIDGVTVFNHAEISRIYKRYIGKRLSFDVAWTIANKITNHYRKAGYPLSQTLVPVQKMDSDVINLTVLENGGA